MIYLVYRWYPAADIPEFQAYDNKESANQCASVILKKIKGRYGYEGGVGVIPLDVMEKGWHK